MTASEFRATAILACEKYYRYLSNLPKGTSGSKISLLSKKRMTERSAEFFCTLSEPLRYYDTAFVLICDREPEYEIEISRVDPLRRQAVLTVPACADNFEALDPSDIMICSDLKYLVKRLENYYREGGGLTFSPPAPQQLPPCDYPGLAVPSEEQAAAIHGMLTNPVSYVWGPPGTGKTLVVLANGLLRYLHAKKRVFLLAPTNNAVEQMLRGILPILRRAGIDLSCVYRLGTSTATFAREFPEVVGDRALEMEQTYWQERIRTLEQEREDAEAHYALLSKIDVTIAYISDILPRLTELQEKRQQKTVLLAEKRRQLSALDLQLGTAGSALCTAQEAFDAHEEQMRECCRLIRGCWKKNLGFSRDEIMLTIRFSELQRYSAGLEKAVKEQRSMYAALTDQSNALKDEIDALTASLEKAQQKSSELLTHINNSENCTDPVGALQKELHSCLEKRDSLRTTTLRSLEAIDADLEEAQNALQNLEKHSKVRQRENALVLASTIDSALRDFPPKNGAPICHVFLDEAGYTSVVRGMIAFFCGCPVTFLGDHKQLAPVCENNRIEKADAEISLFSVPVVYFDTVLSGTPSDIYRLNLALEKSKNDISPATDQLSFYSLRYSYRFSNRLASLLSELTYCEPFFGMPEAPFEIVVLDAPGNGSGARTSSAEVTAIHLFLQSYADSIGSYVVLSPYVSQVKLLRKVLKHPELVTTVHRSQGQEYDTVILSVTDGYAARPWYSDSAVPQGRRVLNTAVSRAKSRLVLVCDVAYWQPRKEQLVSRLISIADRVIRN